MARTSGSGMPLEKPCSAGSNSAPRAVLQDGREQGGDVGESSDLGKLLLRITVAGLMIGHGIHKIQNGIGGIEGMIDAKGLPTILAYGVYAGEVLAPLLLLVGFQTRLAALLLAGNMVVALWLAHSAQLTEIAPSGAPTLELPYFYLLAALSIMLLGAGKFAIDGRKKKLD